MANPRISAPTVPSAALATLLALAALLATAGGGGAQAQGTDGDESTIRDIERQIDLQSIEAADSASATGDDLWEEYQRYRTREPDSGDLRASAERVEIGGNIVVEADEHVEGDVVAVGGQVTVHGTVDGDVVAVGGDVNLSDGAVVKGDAVAVGGRVYGTGDVAGERVSVDFPFPFTGAFTFSNGPIHRPRALGIVAFVVTLLIGLLLALLLQFLAGKRLDVTSRRIDAEPGMSFLVGLLASVGAPFALLIGSLLLLVTIIGIPLIPVLFALLWLAAFAGLVAASIAVGRRITHSGSGDGLGPTSGVNRQIFIGYLLLHVFFFLGAFFRALAWIPVAWLFQLLGFFVILFASMLGFGALFTSRFGTDPGRAVAAAASAGGWAPQPPPPPPPPPGSVTGSSVGLVGEMPPRPDPGDAPENR